MSKKEKKCSFLAIAAYANVTSFNSIDYKLFTVIAFIVRFSHRLKDVCKSLWTLADILFVRQLEGIYLLFSFTFIEANILSNLVPANLAV